jgi:predicted  nucleic acid-binding Zn-ribbon protein
MVTKNVAKKYRETCIRCGYDGYATLEEMQDRSGCPRCGAGKLPEVAVKRLHLRKLYGKRAVEVYQFKKGQKLRLDAIYFIQAIGKDWWDYAKPAEAGEAPGEDIIITKSIKITIVIEES